MTMTTVTVSQEIQAPIEEVFEHFTTPSKDKRLDLHSDHVKEYREVERGEDFLDYEFVFQAFGIRFWGHGREDFERPRRSLLRVIGGALEGAQIELTFQPIANGTRVTQTTCLPPRALGPIEALFGRLLLARIRAITAVHLDEHKRDIEGRPPGSDRTSGKSKRFSPLDFFRMTRAISLPLVLLPLLGGAVLGATGHLLSLGRLAATLLGGALALAAGNLMNDIWDFPAGADHAAQAMPDAQLTGSGVLIDGKLSLRGAWLAVALLVAGALACAALLTAGRPLVPLFAAAGLLVSLFYQAPPIRASYRGYGAGELCIWATFGPIPVVGSFYVQTGRLSTEAMGLGAVFGLGAALVLYCHHFLHWRADRLAGKRSPVAMLGPQPAARLGIALAAAYALGTGAIAHRLGAHGLAVLLPACAPVLLLPSLLGFARKAGAPAWRLLSSAFTAYVLASAATVFLLWRG